MARRLFRLLMRLFPSDYRGDYGRDMAASFDEELRARRDVWSRVRVWRRNAAAALRLGPRLHAEQIWQDARYAVRGFVRAPLFSLTAIAGLAIGVGGTAVTFAIADGFLLKPLPFPNPERLVHIWADDRTRGISQARVSLQEFEAWSAARDVLESAAVFNYTSESATGGAEPERIPSGRVGANVFDVLGVAPELGRTFRPGDDAPGAEPVVLLSHRFWIERFAGDPGVTTKTLELGGRPHRILGVMPASCVFPLPITEIWVPAVLDRERYRADVQPFQVVARLRPGITRQQASHALAAASARAASSEKALESRSANVVPLASALNFAYDIFSVGAIVVGISNILLLLTVSANISSLMLGRAVSRGREVAIRAAVGASRFRLLRQFAVESLLLALAGALAGGVIAAIALPAIDRVIPARLYRIAPFALDARGIGVVLALAVVSAAAFGLAPALRFARVNLADAMRQDGGTGSTSRSSLRLQSSLVVKQVAITIVLLVGTMLVNRSLHALNGVNPGFDAAGVLSVQTILPPQSYASDAAVRNFQDEVLAAAHAVPGVTSAAFVDYLPLNHEYDELQINVPGQTIAAGPTRPTAASLTVTPEYFDVLRIRREAGRAFDGRDRDERAPVVMINTTMASRYWPGRSAVSRTFFLEGFTEPVTVAGVVADSLQVDLADHGRAQVFIPQAQQPKRYVRLLVRTNGDPANLTRPVSAAIHRIDPRLPLTEVQPLSFVVDQFLLPQRALGGGLIVMGGFSLILGVLGIYGIVACYVAERTRELGIRTALGAEPRQLIRMVTGRGLRLAVRGAAVGLPLAILAAYLLRGMLFGVGMGDPLTYVSVTAGVAGVALAASALPASRAARIDPVRAMKD